MAPKPKLTRIPKIPDLIAQGVPAEAIPTYCCLADHANNNTGLCWPKMETLAAILNRSVRTVQRHLYLLKELGLIEFLERRRHKGRYSSYLYRILHIAQSTTGHGRRMAKRDPNKRRTKPVSTTPKSPSKNVKEGYEWLFDQGVSADSKDSGTSEAEGKQKTEAQRRTEGYEWLFK